MHEACLLPLFVGYQFDEADQILFQESADKDAAIQKRGLHLVQAIQVHTVMAEAPTLPNRGLVVDAGNAPNESLVERHLLNDHAVFCGFANLVSDLEINLIG